MPGAIYRTPNANKQKAKLLPRTLRSHLGINTTHTKKMAKVGDLEFAPIRSLDDFLLESARFQVPSVKDLEKWNNRIINNLLYYQTNYYLLIGAVFILVG